MLNWGNRQRYISQDQKRVVKSTSFRLHDLHLKMFCLHLVEKRCSTGSWHLISYRANRANIFLKLNVKSLDTNHKKQPQAAQFYSFITHLQHPHDVIRRRRYLLLVQLAPLWSLPLLPARCNGSKQGRSRALHWHRDCGVNQRAAGQGAEVPGEGAETLPDRESEGWVKKDGRAGVKAGLLRAGEARSIITTCSITCIPDELCST